MRTLVPVLFGASLVATAAQAQRPDGQFHDCYTSKRPATYAIEATADGAPLRLSARAARALAYRGWRFFSYGRIRGGVREARTEPIELSCVAVADRPRDCIASSRFRPGRARQPNAVALESETHAWLTADVLAAMGGARLTEPAGVWPINIKVWSRISAPGDPSLVPCGST
jgi:hypothetical protein